MKEYELRHALVEALRQRGVDVVTPLDVSMIQTTDEEQLDYATTQGRTLYTFNMGDFCRFMRFPTFASRDSHLAARN